MIWPFRRRRTHHQEQKADEPPPPKLDDGFAAVPIFDTQYEDIIIALLERAREVAASKSSGDQVTVYLTDDEWERCEFPLLMVLPVYQRAGDYGLAPESSYNQEFNFTVL